MADAIKPAPTRFVVQWEEHPAHLASRLGHLLESQTLVDITLMCNTHTLRVHRCVLAACSPYFENLLQNIAQRQLTQHPLIVLKDMQFSVLKSMIEFMYCGETNVTDDDLGPLLQAARFFQVKGLSSMSKEALGITSKTTRPKVNGIQLLKLTLFWGC
jgi:BTB/POZ domain